MSDLIDLRELINSRLDVVAVEKIDELIARAFEVEKKAWGHCPNCNQSVQVSIPDVTACAKALGELANQGKGKPRETVRHEVNVSMSLEEVRAAKLRLLEAHPELKEGA